MIILLLAGIIADFFTLVLFFLGYYLWRQWHIYNHTAAHDYAQHCLYGLIAILLFSFLGKFLVIPLLSKRRKTK